MHQANILLNSWHRDGLRTFFFFFAKHVVIDMSPVGSRHGHKIAGCHRERKQLLFLVICSVVNELLELAGFCVLLSLRNTSDCGAV